MTILEQFTDPDSSFKRKLNFRFQQRKRIYQKIGSMVKNGMPIPQALETLVSQQRDRGAKRATITAMLTRWRRGMLDGYMLSEVARNDLPDADLILLRAGEQSGQLDRAVANILYLQESTKKMKGAIKGGLAYPTVLLALAFGLMNFVTYMMVPVYAEFQAPEKWTGAAGALASGAWFAANILPWLMLVLIAGIGVSMWSLPRWIGPTRQKFDSYLPWSVYKLYHGTNFLIALAGLVREGVKSNDALAIIMKGATPWMRERVAATLRRMEDGEKIATALYKTGYKFPDEEIVDDLRAYETFDNFDQMLEELGKDALETAIMRVNAQMRIFFNIAILLFGSVLLWYIIGMAGMNSMIGEMANKTN